MPTQTPPNPGRAKRALPVAGAQSVATPPKVRPDFFIVGAPKCGTTALSDYLAAHPDIFMARKEMHFFGRDLHFGGQFYRRAEAEYLAEFAGWDGERRVGEASVWYLFSETAAAEIKAFNPDSRIIIMLREPAEMMYSLFRYFQYDGNEPLADFEAALQAEPQRRAGKKLGRQTYLAQALAYRETARYHRQVQRYFETFGRARVEVVLYEDLAANPAAVYHDTLEFLEVDTAHRLPRFERVNPAKTIKSRALRAVLRDPAVRTAVLSVRPLLPNAVFKGFQRVEEVLHGINASTERPQPLDPKLKARLRGEFAGEVAKLSRLIGRDLACWTANSEPRKCR